MPLIDVRPITSLHESFTGQNHWLGVCHPRFDCVWRFTGLAVADLVSR
jgi:hypothetical protein